MERVDSTVDMLKQAMIALDKKVDAEMNIRLQSEDEVRQWFGTQLQVVKQSQQMENSAALDREKQMMIQLNQGLASISEIVKQVKA